MLHAISYSHTTVHQKKTTSKEVLITNFVEIMRSIDSRIRNTRLSYNVTEQHLKF